MLQSLLHMTTALHVSGVTSTHLQEHITTVTTASGNRYTVLLSAAIVEELELIWVCCGWRTPPTTHSKQLSDKVNSVKCVSSWDLCIRLLRCTDRWTLNLILRSYLENENSALYDNAEIDALSHCWLAQLSQQFRRKKSQHFAFFKALSRSIAKSDC
jgi:hypothetical protein